MPLTAHFPGAAALALLLPLLPAGAFAASATAAQNLNVRSGPSTTYSVVAQLKQGDTVDVRQCEGVFCQVTFGGKSGWVSASFLTRDFVPKPPAAAVAAAGSSVPAPAGFPPAYSATPPSGAGNEETLASVAPADDQGDPGMDGGTYPDQGSVSSVTLPRDSGQSVVSVGAPRPKADVPGGALTGPDDETAADADPEFADGPDGPASRFDLPTPADSQPGWSDRFGRFGWRADVAAADAAPDEACLIAEVGRRGICVGAGQTARDVAHGGYSVGWLRNPAHLDVTICTTFGDCRDYRTSGPLRLAPGEAVSSISADDPAF